MDAPAGLPQLVPLPATVLRLRDARTQSSRSVALQRFQIGRTPVTQAEHARVLQAHPSETSALPAHPVTWFDAVLWCNLASEAAGLTHAYTVQDRRVLWEVSADGFRLPTEAEWEAACRAGTAGATYGPLADIAWTAKDRVTGPQEVARKQPNAFGLFDTIGNVWEWCWDYQNTGRYGEYRSLRGGGWADEAWSCRASVRRGTAPDAELEDVGFRVARGSVGVPGEQEAQGWSAAADRERADVRGPLPAGWTPLRELLD